MCLVNKYQVPITYCMKLLNRLKKLTCLVKIKRSIKYPTLATITFFFLMKILCFVWMPHWKIKRMPQKTLCSSLYYNLFHYMKLNASEIFVLKTLQHFQYLNQSKWVKHIVCLGGGKVDKYQFVLTMECFVKDCKRMWFSILIIWLLYPFFLFLYTKCYI